MLVARGLHLHPRLLPGVHGVGDKAEAVGGHVGGDGALVLFILLRCLPQGSAPLGGCPWATPVVVGIIHFESCPFLLNCPQGWRPAAPRGPGPVSGSGRGGHSPTRAKAGGPRAPRPPLSGQARPLRRPGPRGAAARGPHCAVTVAGRRDGAAAGADRADPASRLHGGHGSASRPRRSPAAGRRRAGAPGDAVRRAHRSAARAPGAALGAAGRRRDSKAGPRPPPGPRPARPPSPTQAPPQPGSGARPGRTRPGRGRGRAPPRGAPAAPGPARRLPGGRAGGRGQGGRP